MNHPAEFFQKRSFEVVHAAFRVAAVIARPAVREMLEDRALEFFEIKDVVSLELLQEGVDFCAKIGEISEINAQILLREIGVLVDIARQHEMEEEKLYHNIGKQEDVSLEGMFSESSPPFADFANYKDSFDKNTSTPDISREMKKNIIPTDSGNTTLKDHIVDNKSGNQFLDSRLEERIKTDVFDSIPISGNNPEISGNNTLEKIIEEKKSAKQSLYAAERREFIVSFLRNKAFCNVNEIMERLPQVSDRTIRYDIKALVDSKIVERVGNGGPNSYFRLKRGSAQI